MDQGSTETRRRVGDLLLLTFVIVVMVLLGVELGRGLASTLADPGPPAPASSRGEP